MLQICFKKQLVFKTIYIYIYIFVKNLSNIFFLKLQNCFTKQFPNRSLPLWNELFSCSDLSNMRVEDVKKNSLLWVQYWTLVWILGKFSLGYKSHKWLMISKLWISCITFNQNGQVYFQIWTTWNFSIKFYNWSCHLPFSRVFMIHWYEEKFNTLFLELKG